MKFLMFFLLSFVKIEMPAYRYAILYGSDESSKAPYFVRNQNKYPDLLPQPGIKIDCVSATLNYLLHFSIVLVEKSTDIDDRLRRAAPSPSTGSSGGPPR